MLNEPLYPEDYKPHPEEEVGRNQEDPDLFAKYWFRIFVAGTAAFSLAAYLIYNFI